MDFSLLDCGVERADAWKSFVLPIIEKSWLDQSLWLLVHGKILQFAMPAKGSLWR